MIAGLQAHPFAGAILVFIAIVLAIGVGALVWLSVRWVCRQVDGWRYTRRWDHHYHRHVRPVPVKDPVWDEAETGQIDQAWDDMLDPLPRGDDIRSVWAEPDTWQRPRTVNHAPWDSAQFPAITDLPGVPSNGKHARQHNLPDRPAPVHSLHGTAGEPALLQPGERIPGAAGNPTEEAKTGAVLAPASIAPVPPWPVQVINLTIVRQQVIMPPLHEAYERTAGYGDHGWQPAQAGIYTGSLQYVQDILDAEYVDGQLMLEGAA